GWDNDRNLLNTELLLIDNELTLIKGNGNIDLVNSKLNLNLQFDNTPFALLEITKPKLFYNLQGFASGNLLLHGKTNNLLVDGVLTPSPEVGIGFHSIKTTYYTSEPVSFRNDSIIFDSMDMRDEYNNPGVFSGTIKHQNFQNMIFDLSLKSEKILAINTDLSDNKRFYGTAFVNGTLGITGQAKDVTLNGNFKSEKGTALYIPLERRGKAIEYDFVHFVNSSTEEKVNYYQTQHTGISMNFDVEVTPDAKVQLIFNSRNGDIIKAEGFGNLQVNIDPAFHVEMYGDYIIEEGDYLFSLENILNKRFSIDRGSSIKWMGNPYNAELDISAIYRVKTSLYDLFLDSYQDEDFKRRIPVDCIILLKDKLEQPLIDFDIELPTAEESLKDQVAQLIATQEDVNKQIISLLMLGRFYTPEFFNGRPTAETGAELVGTTASELISNQLSNWLSQITDELNIGINYRPGNDISNDQVELALSTQILDDRVTIDGNIANNANPTTNNSGDFVGDFDVNIKLTENGKLQFKAYTHSNDDLIYDTAPTTQGIGFIYREEFNTLKELFQYYKETIFRKKEKVDKKGKVQPEI
ncbi:MAG: translocation/assembly module TamB, partial [Prolixibacteraceae bacterium]|nr:translocation/assembly module TamB [Prolixibacteraceae bacterium]